MKYDVNLTFEGDPAIAAQWAGFAKKKAREFGEFCVRQNQSHGTKWYDINAEVKIRVRYINGIQKAHIVGAGMHGIAIFPLTSSFTLGWGVPFTEDNFPPGTAGGAWPDVIIPYATRVIRGPSYAAFFGIADADVLQYGNVNWKLMTYDKGTGYGGMRQRHNGSVPSSFYHAWYYENGKQIFVGVLSRVRGIAHFLGHAVAIGTKLDGTWCLAVSPTPEDAGSWYSALTFTRTGLTGGSYNMTPDFLFSSDGGRAISIQVNGSGHYIVEKISISVDPDTGFLIGARTTQDIGSQAITFPALSNNTQYLGQFGHESSASSTPLSFGYDWSVIWGGPVSPTTSLEGSRDAAVLTAVSALDGGIWEYVSKTVLADVGNDTGILYTVDIRLISDNTITNTVTVTTRHAQGWEIHASWSLADTLSGVLGGRQILGIDFVRNLFTDDEGNPIDVPAMAVLAPSASSIYTGSRSSTCIYDSVPTYTEDDYTANEGGEYANGHSESTTTHAVNFQHHVMLDIVVLADPNNSGAFDVEIFRSTAGTVLDDLGVGISDSSTWIDDQTDNIPLVRSTTRTRNVTIGNWRKSDHRLIVSEMNIAEGAFVVHNVLTSYQTSGVTSSFTAPDDAGSEFPNYRMAFRNTNSLNIGDPFGTPLIPLRSTFTGTETDGANTAFEMPPYSAGYTIHTSEKLTLLRASYAHGGSNITKDITPAGGTGTHDNVVSSPNFTGTTLDSFTSEYMPSTHNDYSGAAMQIYRNRVAVTYSSSFWSFSEYAAAWANNSMYCEPLRDENRLLIDYSIYDIRELVGTTGATSQKLLPNRFGVV